MAKPKIKTQTLRIEIPVDAVPVARVERHESMPEYTVDYGLGGPAAMVTVTGMDAAKVVAVVGAAYELLQVAELAAAFVGMHTGGGVPNEYMGRFNDLLENPKLALDEIQSVLYKVKGVR